MPGTRRWPGPCSGAVFPRTRRSTRSRVGTRGAIDRAGGDIHGALVVGHFIRASSRSWSRRQFFHVSPGRALICRRDVSRRPVPRGFACLRISPISGRHQIATITSSRCTGRMINSDERFHHSSPVRFTFAQDPVSALDSNCPLSLRVDIGTSITTLKRRSIGGIPAICRRTSPSPAARIQSRYASERTRGLPGARTHSALSDGPVAPSSPRDRAARRTSARSWQPSEFRLAEFACARTRTTRSLWRFRI